MNFYTCTAEFKKQDANDLKTLTQVYASPAAMEIHRSTDHTGHFPGGGNSDN